MQRLLDGVATPPDPAWLAVVNARDAVVVAGTRVALARVADAAIGAGARRTVPLDVAVASHCPVQEPAARAVAGALAGVPHRVPTAGVVLGTGRRTTSAAAVLEDLAAGVARPVRWHDAARLLPELGVRRAVQVPPGRVLLDLLPTPPSGPALDAVALDAATLDRDVAGLAGLAGPAHRT